MIDPTPALGRLRHFTKADQGYGRPAGRAGLWRDDAAPVHPLESSAAKTIEDVYNLEMWARRCNVAYGMGRDQSLVARAARCGGDPSTWAGTRPSRYRRPHVVEDAPTWSPRRTAEPTSVLRCTG